MEVRSRRLEWQNANGTLVPLADGIIVRLETADKTALSPLGSPPRPLRIPGGARIYSAIEGDRMLLPLRSVRGARCLSWQLEMGRRSVERRLSLIRQMGEEWLREEQR